MINQEVIEKALKAQEDQVVYELTRAMSIYKNAFGTDGKQDTTTVAIIAFLLQQKGSIYD